MWVCKLFRQVTGGSCHFRKSKYAMSVNAHNMSRITRRYQHSQPVQKMEILTLNPPSEYTPYTLTKDQEHRITEGKPEKQMKLQQLMLKLYVKREEGVILPMEIRMEDLQVMTQLGAMQLTKMIDYLRRRHYSNVKRAQEKEEYQDMMAAIREGRAVAAQELEHPGLQYTLNQNSLFPRIYKTNITRLHNTHLGKGLQFGQEVILDCSYDSYMDELRIKHAAKQIIYCLTQNRRNERPFSLHLCNVDGDSRLMYYLRRMHPDFEYDVPVGIHNCSYLDIFNSNRLMYLSPDSTEVLEYNPNDIYILGAYVDKIVGLPISRQKASKEKIRSAALPLREHLAWKKGAKSLCIHQVFGALLYVKNTGDWSQALLQNVPHRKFFEKIDL